MKPNERLESVTVYPNVKAVSQLITTSSDETEREKQINDTSNFEISLHLPKAKTEPYTGIAGIDKQRTSILVTGRGKRSRRI